MRSRGTITCTTFEQATIGRVVEARGEWEQAGSNKSGVVRQRRRGFLRDREAAVHYSCWALLTLP